MAFVAGSADKKGFEIDMKKSYVKPELYVENFSLAQSVATACGAAQKPGFGKPTYGDKTTCGWDTGGPVIWTAENAGCRDKRPENGVFPGVCYNNPNGGASIFSYS